MQVPGEWGSKVNTSVKAGNQGYPGKGTREATKTGRELWGPWDRYQGQHRNQGGFRITMGRTGTREDSSPDEPLDGVLTPLNKGGEPGKTRRGNQGRPKDRQGTIGGFGIVKGKMGYREDSSPD